MPLAARPFDMPTLVLTLAFLSSDPSKKSSGEAVFTPVLHLASLARPSSAKKKSQNAVTQRGRPRMLAGQTLAANGQHVRYDILAHLKSCQRIRSLRIEDVCRTKDVPSIRINELRGVL